MNYYILFVILFYNVFSNNNVHGNCYIILQPFLSMNIVDLSRTDSLGTSLYLLLAY